MDVLLVLSAIFTRLIFLTHGIISVYVLYESYETLEHLLLIIPILGLITETILTLCKRKMTQFKYFWPCGFFYITTILPIIWIIELELMQDRLDARDTLNLDDQGINRTLSKRLTKTFQNKLGISIDVFGKKMCELGLFIGLIIGRWLIPRGSITRDQLSALLLGYVGTTADILEIFELFKEEEVMYEEGVTYAVISVYSLALYQFTLVTTATSDDKEPENEDIFVKLRDKIKTKKIYPDGRTLDERFPTDVEKQKYVEMIKKEEGIHKRFRGRGKGKKLSAHSKMLQKIAKTKAAKEEEILIQRREIHAELFQIIVTLFMLDTPFLALRLYVIVIFKITSEMHVFFTCKNILVLLLLVYRLLILNCNGVDEDVDLSREDAYSKLANVQQALEEVTEKKEIIGYNIQRIN